MINKALLKVIFGLITLFVISCSKKKDDTTIVLNRDSIELIAGAKDTVSILSDSHEYVVTTDNENVASATIDGENIIIKTSEMGNAILTVKDQLNNTSEINVSAVGPRYGGWIEEFPVGVEFTFVESGNEEITEQIKSELLTQAEKRGYRPMYNFHYPDDFSYHSGDGSVTEKGSYSVKDLILTISYDNKKEFYDIISCYPSFMLLKQDLTTEYVEQYPDAGITKVEEYRRLAYITY
jgi:uncharacterized protein YlzI (FlbEa/FlbD family)